MSVAVCNSRTLYRTGKPSQNSSIFREVANILTHTVIGGVHGPLARKRRETALVSTWVLSALVLSFIVGIRQLHAEPPSLAEPAPTPPVSEIEKTLAAGKICRNIESAASENALPVKFFTRLIYQESNFDPNAISSTGAEGIAQFMPTTAASRGLGNPFDVLRALHESASYLRELRNTFGNLGLAAAAYNAGPWRVSRWLAHKATLPQETMDYVQIITGHSVAEWAAPNAGKLEHPDSTQNISCVSMPKLFKAYATVAQTNPAWKPWGVELAGAWNQGSVLASFEQLRRRYAEILGDRQPLILHVRPDFAPAKIYIVRLAENTRPDAERLCTRLKAVGCACDVLRNPPQ